MIHDILAWLAIVLLTPAAYPLARAWLANSPEDDGEILTWTLALALASGLLTLVMLWMSLLKLRYSVSGIVLGYLTVIVVSTWFMRRSAARLQRHHAVLGAEATAAFTEGSSLRRGNRRSWDFRTLAFGCISVITIAILFNAVYWPFTRDDVVALYHPFAQQMAVEGNLIPLIGADSLHRMYPMNIPLGFTFAYMAAGWDNEYLARLLPALLSLGCLPATYILGRRIGGALAGWLAALLLGITPLFGNWASTGYTELPMALYLTLGAVFAQRLWQSGSWTDAVLAGLSVGLATWTKNNALIVVPSLMFWFGWALLHRRTTWQAVVSGMIACACIGAPWYLRNLVAVGALLPDTAWVDQAQRTLERLFIFVTLPDNFGVSGWLMLVGIGWALWKCRNPIPASANVLPVLIWIAPFFAAWWLFASYDPRFLASLLPMLCALAAPACLAGWERVPLGARRPAGLALALVAVVLTLYSAYFVVEYKDEFLRDPLMSGDARMSIVESRRLHR